MSREGGSILTPNEPSFNRVGVQTGLGIPVISAIEARWLLNKKCMGFLASIIEEPKDRLIVNEIRVACENPYVPP